MTNSEPGKHNEIGWFGCFGLRTLKRWAQVAAEESGPGPKPERDFSILMSGADVKTPHLASWIETKRGQPRSLPHTVAMVRPAS